MKKTANDSTNNNQVNSKISRTQVNNILTKIKQIKNTKQIYNNKKGLGLTKIHRRKERVPLYSINNNSFIKSRPSYSRLSDTNINNQFYYYSRSNSNICIYIYNIRCYIWWI